MNNLNWQQPSNIAFGKGSSKQVWNLLLLLSSYRLVTAAGLFVAGATVSKYGVLGATLPELYVGAAIGYVLIAFFWLFTIFLFKQAYLPQVYFQFITDLLFLSVLMHASGGAQSGISFLLVISIAVNSILVSNITGYFFAAVSALSVLVSTIYNSLIHNGAENDFASSGLIGIVFFSIALLVNLINRRSKESERLSIRQLAAIQQLEQLNKLVLDQAQHGVLLIDRQRHVKLINQHAIDMLNPHFVPLNGSLELADYSTTLDLALSNWQLENKPVNNSFNISGLGQAYEVQASFSVLAKNQQNVLITLTNVSSLAKQMQAQKLASLGRLTASVAHEIRNPLSAISQAAQLLSEKKYLQQNDGRLLAIIFKQVSRMDKMVDSILQLSKRGKVVTSNIELNSFLAGFCLDFCFEHNLPTTAISYQSSNATSIACDSGHLRQILQNICHNSCKYGLNQDGELKISIWLDFIGLENVAICASDAGEGIADAKQNHIFEPFHTSSSDSPGLGLYICSELAELNNMELSYVPATDDKPHHFKLMCKILPNIA